MLTIPADAICLGWPHDNIPQASYPTVPAPPLAGSSTRRCPRAPRTLDPAPGVIPALVAGTHASTRRTPALRAAVRRAAVHRAAGPCLASTSSLRRAMSPGHKARDDTGAWSWPMRRPLPERFSVAPPTSIIRALACPTTGRIIDAPMSACPTDTCPAPRVSSPPVPAPAQAWVDGALLVACPTDARPTPRCHPGACLPRRRPGSPGPMPRHDRRRRYLRRFAGRRDDDTPRHHHRPRASRPRPA